MKTTNPSLIRRFYLGELEVGDHSKDFIVEHDYCLVFIGKIPHRKTKTPMIVAWKERHSSTYYRHSYDMGHPLYEMLMKKYQPPVYVTVELVKDMDRTATIIHTLLCTLAVTDLNRGEDKARELVESINKLYTRINRNHNMVWRHVEERPEGCEGLWNGKMQWDIDGLPDSFKTEIMIRRLS
jgi:hypothetical protein